jgi:ABC-2 type transport system permease protein
MTATLSLVEATLRGRRSVMLWFGLVGAALGLLMASLYETVIQGIDMQQYLDTMPEELMAVFGMSSEGITDGVFPFETYLATEFFIWFSWGVAVWGLIAGCGLIAGEVENGTIDMMLAQPVRRERYILARFAGVLAVLLVIALACWVGLLAGLTMTDVETSILGLLMACLQMALLGLAVAGVALVISVWTLGTRRSQMIMVGILLVQYVMDLAAKISADLEWLGPLSVFHYFDPADIVRTGAPAGMAIVVLVGVATIGAAAATMLFARRDMAR